MHSIFKWNRMSTTQLQVVWDLLFTVWTEARRKEWEKSDIDQEIDIRLKSDYNRLKYMLRQLVSRLGASYTMYVIGSMRGYTEI